MKITTLEMIQELLKDNSKVFKSKNCHRQNVIAKFGSFINSENSSQSVGIFLNHDNKKTRPLEITFGSYGDGIMTWLWEEVDQIDWSKVQVDTPILVSDDGASWQRKYFSNFENGEVYAWNNGATSWSSCGKKSIWKHAKLAK